MTANDKDKTVINIDFPKKMFACFKNPAPPVEPNPPPPPTYPANIGTQCTSAEDKCGNTDDKTDNCCGYFTGGMILEKDGKTDTKRAAPNVVVCNMKTPDVDFVTLYKDADGVMVTANYPKGNFTCLSGAKAIVASAVALVAAAAMM